MAGLLFAALSLSLQPLPASAKSDDAAVAAGLIECAPSDYDAALLCLDKWLTPQTKDDLRDEKGAIRAHFGLGLFLRNNWGLWSNGLLAKSLRAEGVVNPDDMSGVILDGYSAKLRDVPFDRSFRVVKGEHK